MNEITQEAIMAAQSQDASAPTIFNFVSNTLRVVMRDGEPWFVAADVCTALGVQNVTQAVDRLDDDERSMFNIGRQGEACVINESGLYSLILGSRKPEAKKFKKWVTSEVLPAIRKTGRYQTQASEIPAKRIIRSREDLSFTRRDSAGRIINWALDHDQNELWNEKYLVGQRFLEEIAELAQHDEREAYDAVRFAFAGEFRHGVGTEFTNRGWGQECGFAEAIARAVIDGLRRRRDGVDPFDPSGDKKQTRKALPKGPRRSALPAMRPAQLSMALH